MGAGESLIEINGIKSLKSDKWDVLFDRIEAGTYMVAGAITNGHVKINKIKPETIKIISSKLIEMGAIVNSGDDWVEVDATKTNLFQKIYQLNHSQFSYYMPQFMVNSTSNGSSIIEETVENRFQ